jgi:hypothetical protein
MGPRARWRRRRPRRSYAGFVRWKSRRASYILFGFYALVYRDFQGMHLTKHTVRSSEIVSGICFCFLVATTEDQELGREFLHGFDVS